MATFSRANFNSALYRTFRPTYTPALYNLLYQFHTEHGGMFGDVVDVGTGTGQVAEALSEKFQMVQATDRSSTMLSNAVQGPNITYLQAPAEQLPFVDSSIDAVTSGQAFHWFDHPRFFEEIRRVLKPRGTLAIFGYSYVIIAGNKEATDIIYDYANNELGPYWESGRLLIDNYYRSINFPFHNVQWYFSHEGLDNTGLGKVSPLQFMEQRMTIEHFETYIKTWSSYATYKDKFPDAEDPAERVVRRLEKVIDVSDRDKDTFTVQWPTVLILAENDG